MYFYKQTFSDANENVFKRLFSNFKTSYQKKINYTYNYD